MLKKVPVECPNCEADGKTYLRTTRSEVGLSARVSCNKCGWFDELETEEGRMVGTVRNWAIGVGAAAAILKVLNDMTKPK